MKYLIISIAFFSLKLFASSCCIGSGPKSFVQLKHLQTYDLGVASSFRDVYARFNPYGNRVSNEKNQTYTIAFGASARVTPRSEIYGILPFVGKTKAFGGETKSRSNIGDVSLGTKVQIYEPFYDEDWFPEMKLLASIKAPSGKTDTIENNGNIVPGTGNGIWEASLGSQLSKDFGDLIVNFTVSFTKRFSQNIKTLSGQDELVHQGDRFELSEGVAIPVSERLSLNVGSNQVFDFDGSIGSVAVNDSGGRYTTGFLGGSYFITRLWTLSAAFESVLPIEKLSVNQEAYRTFTITSTYAIY